MYMEIFDRTIIETREKSYVMLFMKIIVYNIVKSAIVCVRLILPWGGYQIDPIEQFGSRARFSYFYISQ